MRLGEFRHRSEELVTYNELDSRRSLAREVVGHASNTSSTHNIHVGLLHCR